MQLDRLTLGRMAKELGFVRDTLEKVCRLADVLKFMEADELLAEAIALKGGTAINLTIFDLPRLSVDIDLDYCSCGWEAGNSCGWEARNIQLKINTNCDKIRNQCCYKGYIQNRKRLQS